MKQFQLYNTKQHKNEPFPFNEFCINCKFFGTLKCRKKTDMFQRWKKINCEKFESLT
ncbi:MAG: hypothetical protein [Wendovervirus sonii]|uniref:Uncharacterized protein n=1 Tax=phage Lak_Megaphage_Sonny TaxID=3109229 RepID=A0ABZ0Z402_9CAUD|nr:MAG: hypothetical protein [phage Lak_Megaphage_Sonny]